MPPDDKIDKRYGKLDDLIELLSHFKCTITVADHVIIKIEDIDAKGAEVKR